MWFSSRKIRVRDSGIFEHFCDYHCHLLPEVDDGVAHEAETMRTLALWEQLSVQQVWLTPHIMEDIPNKTSELRCKFEALAARYCGSVQLHLAAEHMLDGLFLRRIEEGDLLPIGSQGSMLLVETSYYTAPMNMEKILEQIKQKGYTPLLAHPERYQYMEQSDYCLWKDRGVLLQLNVPSLVGADGPEVQAKARKLLNLGLYDCCGTDTHSIEQLSYFLESPISTKVVKKLKRLIERGL